MAVDPGDLGRRIAEARRDVGLTQDECAARAAMERTALAKIETGARRVAAAELARLAGALDVRIEWLFDEAPSAVVSRRNAAEPGAVSIRAASHTSRPHSPRRSSSRRHETSKSIGSLTHAESAAADSCPNGATGASGLRAIYRCRSIGCSPRC